MIRNFIKIALRSLLKQRIYSAINITGLAAGIASCALITLYVLDEFSFDRFHQKGDLIHKFVLERIYPDHVTKYHITPHSFGQVLRDDFPEIVNMVRLAGGGNNTNLVQYVNEQGDDRTFEETRLMLADSAFFEMFSIRLLEGDPESVLIEPQSIVLTEAMAVKYFGDEEPVGKSMNIDNNPVKVTGICEDVPENSHFEFDFLVSLSTFPFFQQDNFMGFSTHTYVELAPETAIRDLESKFDQMVETYASGQIQQNLNTSFEDYIAAGNGYNYFLVPLTKIHLDPTSFEGKLKPGGSITYVYIFISIAALILVIACINFMNLATARSTERAREVGIRKTLGSQRKQLIGQFLVESVIICLVAALISLGLMYLVLPYFNQLAGKSLTLDPGGFLLPGLFLTALVVGLLAGSYPAFVLSAFNTSLVMKGTFSSNRSGRILRSSLVVFQFAISIFLIAGTLVVGRQMAYIQKKNLGFNKDNLLVIERANSLEDQLDPFVEEVRRLPDITSVAVSNSMPGRFYFGSQFVPQGSTEVLTTNGMTVGDGYIESMGIELLEGRAFSEEFNDSLAVIVNEQTVELLGTDDPIGFTMTLSAANPPAPVITIVGVVKDFHYMSLRDPITPFVLFSNEGAAGGNFFISVRMNSDDIQTTIAAVQNQWKELAPEQPFKYTFFDEDLFNQYRNEANSGRIFGIFSVLAIIIACVGLFGLAAYTAGLRTKEIGVRKVMGASVGSVVILLSKDFTRLIIIAFVIAVPFSWYFMDRWLDNFAYATSINIDVFIIAGVAALMISWLTVSYQSIKAAIVNPVESLRSE